MVSRLAMVGLTAIGCATASVAAPKLKTAVAAPKAKLAAAVNVENKRAVSLIFFEIVMTGGNDREKVVAKLEKPLASGESAKLPLTGADGCIFEARWKFEDVGDAGSVDLCSDAHIVLVD